MNVLDKLHDAVRQCDELISTASPELDVEACRVARHKALLTIRSFNEGRLLQFRTDYIDLFECDRTQLPAVDDYR